MKTLQEVQKKFESIGLGTAVKPFNRIKLRYITLSGVISMFIFLIYEADSAQEYMESAFLVTTTGGTLLCFANTNLTIKKLFSFIDYVDKFVNEGKQNFQAKQIWKNINLISELIQIHK